MRTSQTATLLSRGWLGPAVMCAALVCVSGQLLASPLMSLQTESDWQSALDAGTIGPVPDPYPALPEHYIADFPDYLYTPPELYVYGGGSAPEPSDAGLVDYRIRAYPHSQLLSRRFEMGLMRWL